MTYLEEYCKKGERKECNIVVEKSNVSKKTTNIRVRADCRAVKGRWCRGMTNNAGLRDYVLFELTLLAAEMSIKK